MGVTFEEVVYFRKQCDTLWSPAFTSALWSFGGGEIGCMWEVLGFFC
jgi:hypothetical protein